MEMLYNGAQNVDEDFYYVQRLKMGHPRDSGLQGHERRASVIRVGPLQSRRLDRFDAGPSFGGVLPEIRLQLKVGGHGSRTLHCGMRTRLCVDARVWYMSRLVAAQSRSSAL